MGAITATASIDPRDSRVAGAQSGNTKSKY